MSASTIIAMHVWSIVALVLVCLSVNDMRAASWYDLVRFLALVAFWPVAIPVLLSARKFIAWRNRKAKKGKTAYE